MTCFLKSIRSVSISIHSTPLTRQSFFLLDYFSFKGSNKGSYSLFPFEINLVQSTSSCTNPLASSEAGTRTLLFQQESYIFIVFASFVTIFCGSKMQWLCPSHWILRITSHITLPGYEWQTFPSKITDTDGKVTACLCLFADGESRITCHFSPDTLEHLVKEASERNEWKKLRFLFLGSAASMAARGVCFECDSSCVPLDLLIESNVEDLHNLVFHLLQRGALPDGLKECRRPPLLTAMEMRKFPLAVTLLRNQADPSCIVGHGIYINKEVREIKRNMQLINHSIPH